MDIKKNIVELQSSVDLLKTSEIDFQAKFIKIGINDFVNKVAHFNPGSKEVQKIKGNGGDFLLDL